MLLIGSRAAQFHWSDFRRPNDIDLIATQAEFDNFVETFRRHFTSLTRKTPKKYKIKQDGPSIEIEIADFWPSSQELMEKNQVYATRIYTNDWSTRVFVCNPYDLCRIKRSHLYWPIHWGKNIEDYHWLKNKIKTLSNSTDEEIEDRILGDPIYLQRLKETEEMNGKSSCKTNVNNEKFFDRSNKVGRRYNHDDIHVAVSYYGRPLYERCKPDLNKAYVSHKLFNKLSHEDKLRIVMEECYVIAIERKILPNGLYKALDINNAYLYALQRICTNLTSGWFRDFAIENAMSIWGPEFGFYSQFLSANLKEIQ